MDKKKRLSKVRKNRSPKAILFKKVWTKCAKFVVLRDGGICFTCGEPGNQAGHFRHGKTKLTYFNEKQIRCQCVKCNFFLSGNLGIYGFKLTKLLGAKEVEQIINDSYKQKDWKMAELQKLEEYFTNKLKELE